MPQRDRNRLLETLLVLRESLPTVWLRLREWWEAVRAEPVLMWETTAVRYVTYLVAGAILMTVGAWGVRSLQPGAPGEHRPRAKSADFHVICSNPGCARHFVINRKFGFDDFPVHCPGCGRETGEHAVLCYSSECRGRRVAPVRDEDGRMSCSRCGAELFAPD